MDQKPTKKIYSRKEHSRILRESTDYIKRNLLPDSRVVRIMITGSLVKDDFGEYDKPLDEEKYGYRQVSDIDCVAFVDDDYSPKLEWKLVARRPVGIDPPFWEVYRIGLLEEKYPVECLFIKGSILGIPEAIEIGENKGIPMKPDSSKNKHIIIYQRSDN